MDYIIIVAGGKGLRMGGDIPKQFLPVGGKPVLMRTLERFREYSAELQIILVLPEAQQTYWHQLCKDYHFDVEYTLANGGETRYHSVQNGLKKVPDDAQGVVGVHDGVRPFVSIEVIRACYETARIKKVNVCVIAKRLGQIGFHCRAECIPQEFLCPNVRLFVERILLCIGTCFPRLVQTVTK